MVTSYPSAWLLLLWGRVDERAGGSQGSARPLCVLLPCSVTLGGHGRLDGGGMGDPRGGVSVGLVERFVVQQRFGQLVKLLAMRG